MSGKISVLVDFKTFKAGREVSGERKSAIVHMYIEVPSSITLGERVDRWVRRAARSFKKSLFGLGGR